MGERFGLFLLTSFLSAALRVAAGESARVAAKEAAAKAGRDSKAQEEESREAVLEAEDQ